MKKKIRFSCNKCDKTFSSSNNLGRHVKTTHEGHRFQCNECEKQFIEKSKLQQHVRIKHRGEVLPLKFKCDNAPLLDRL